MSAGSVFRLSANEGRADKLITATDWLNQRITHINASKAANGEDPMPSLAELEETHIIYMHAQFKPHAAIGFEYNKVRVGSGTVNLGGSIQFEIPQFGDFFHDMVCRVRLSSALAKPITAPPDDGTSPLLPADGNGLFYSLVDAQGNAVAAGSTYRNYVQYCEYPANRLMKSVRFDVNGNPLDIYTEDVPMMLEKFCVSPNVKDGCDRLCGQEVPMVGYSGLRNAVVTDADAANTPAGISRDVSKQSNQTVALFDGSDVLGAEAFSKLNAAASQVDVSRKMFQVVNGPQTPKPVQPPLELWHRLRFWFCEDVRLSIPSVAIPFGQRFISCEFSQLKDLVYEVPSIFLRELSVSDGTRVVTHTPINQLGGLESVTIEAAELYINNIFVNKEIHDIFIRRIGFTLVRVYRQEKRQVSDSSLQELRLDNIKWPVEYLMVGLRPSWNTKDVNMSNGVVTGNENQWRDWHRLTRMVDAVDDQAMLSESGVDNAEAVSNSSSVGQIMPDKYFLPVPTVDSLAMNSHGNRIHDEFADTFYNQYCPAQYGGLNFNTPDDVGALFVNLCLFPRSYQPSGSFNFSRARETTLKWTSSYISKTSTAELIVVAIALNFLLISDGSAVLRYTT